MESILQNSLGSSFKTAGHQARGEVIISTPKPSQVRRVISSNSPKSMSKTDYFDSYRVKSWSPFSSMRAISKCSESHQTPTNCTSKDEHTFLHDTTARSQSLTVQPSYISIDKIEQRSKISKPSNILHKPNKRDQRSKTKAIHKVSRFLKRSVSRVMSAPHTTTSPITRPYDARDAWGTPVITSEVLPVNKRSERNRGGFWLVITIKLIPLSHGHRQIKDTDILVPAKLSNVTFEIDPPHRSKLVVTSHLGNPERKILETGDVWSQAIYVCKDDKDSSSIRHRISSSLKSTKVSSMIDDAIHKISGRPSINLRFRYKLNAQNINTFFGYLEVAPGAPQGRIDDIRVGVLQVLAQRDGDEAMKSLLHHDFDRFVAGARSKASSRSTISPIKSVMRSLVPSPLFSSRKRDDISRI